MRVSTDPTDEHTIRIKKRRMRLPPIIWIVISRLIRINNNKNNNNNKKNNIGRLFADLGRKRPQGCIGGSDWRNAATLALSLGSPPREPPPSGKTCKIKTRLGTLTVWTVSILTWCEVMVRLRLC